jgi:hypothetical protein
MAVCRRVAASLPPDVAFFAVRLSGMFVVNEVIGAGDVGL